MREWVCSCSVSAVRQLGGVGDPCCGSPWSQRQGNASITFQGRRYDFSADQSGKTYDRSNLEQGIRFNREGEYTLTVHWRRPGVPAHGTWCVMNPQLYGYTWKPCTISKTLSKTPGVAEGFTVRFVGAYDAPIFSFRPAPGSISTTKARLMIDAQGCNCTFQATRTL